MFVVVVVRFVMPRWVILSILRFYAKVYRQLFEWLLIVQCAATTRAIACDKWRRCKVRKGRNGNECTSLETSPQYQRNAIPAFDPNECKKTGIELERNVTAQHKHKPSQVTEDCNQGRKARTERWNTSYCNDAVSQRKHRSPPYACDSKQSANTKPCSSVPDVPWKSPPLHSWTASAEGGVRAPGRINQRETYFRGQQTSSREKG